MHTTSYFGAWVYKGTVKAFINGQVTVIGRVGDTHLDYWRLFAHGKRSAV